MSKDLELVITRVFDAPRELVFRAWTDRNHLTSWWGPRGFRATSWTMDVRPGGAWRGCMRSTEGLDYWSQGVYREITPPEKLVFTFAWDGDHDMPTTETVVTIFFTEEDGKTKMTLTHTGAPAGENADNMLVGWNQSFDKLAQSVVV